MHTALLALASEIHIHPDLEIVQFGNQRFEIGSIAGREIFDQMQGSDGLIGLTVQVGARTGRQDELSWCV